MEQVSVSVFLYSQFYFQFKFQNYFPYTINKHLEALPQSTFHQLSCSENFE